MIGIQNYQCHQYQSRPSFKATTDDGTPPTKESIDDINNQYNNDADSWKDLADKFDESGGKFGKILGKGARFVAALIGLAGTFMVTKYSTKLTIETLKNLTKKGPAKAVVDAVKGMKKPLSSMAEKAKGLWNNKGVQTMVGKVKDSKLFAKASKLFANPKVQAVLEPLKTTIASLKGKLKNTQFQSIFENVVGATTAASVAVDNISGRNKDKNTLELAMA